MYQYFVKDKEGKYQRKIPLISKVHEFKILDDFLTIQSPHLDYLKQHFRHYVSMEVKNMWKNRHLQVIQYKGH